MRLDDDVMARQTPRGGADGPSHAGRAGQKPLRQTAAPPQSPEPARGAMADAFAQLKRRG